MKVPNLASFILGRIVRRISDDFQNKYGHEVFLLETFVEKQRFTGSCYKAANWIHVVKLRDEVATIDNLTCTRKRNFSLPVNQTIY